MYETADFTSNEYLNLSLQNNGKFRATNIKNYLTLMQKL